MPEERITIDGQSFVRIARVGVVEDHQTAAVEVDANYLHEQLVADSTWTVIHGLGKYPSTTVMDTSGKIMSPQIEHVNTNELLARFFSAGLPIAVSGTMSCN